jgi:hypothetical protein
MAGLRWRKALTHARLGNSVLRNALTRILLAGCLVAVGSSLPARPAVAATSGAIKVAIIVGPVGSLTDNYRARGDRVAAAARNAGAAVVKVYSPRATWSRVLDAVRGANVIVYFGHGNGYPNPYSSSELKDRTNGWGLNRTTTHGDRDDWSKTLVYCGERALLGRLSSSDGAAQRQYCKGGPIRPAAGFVMIYGQAHYAPGFGERYSRSDPRTTYAQARERVRNYSYPVLKLGASGYFATAYGDAHSLVARLLANPRSSYGWAFKQGRGYDADTLRTSQHPDLEARIWVQKTVIKGFHFDQPDFWYAFAGTPGLTPRAAGL